MERVSYVEKFTRDLKLKKNFENQILFLILKICILTKRVSSDKRFSLQIYK